MFYDLFSFDFEVKLSGLLNRAVCGHRQVLSGGLADGAQGAERGRNDSLKGAPELKAAPNSPQL